MHGTASDADRMRRSSQVVSLCAAALTCVGIVMVYSIASAQSMGIGDDFAALRRRLLWLCLGGVGLLVAWQLNLDFLEKHYRAALVMTVLLLVLVFVPGVGVMRNGARRWVQFPIGRGFQPSEFVRWTFVVFFAGFIKAAGPRLRDLRQGYLAAMAAIGLTCGLIFAEPDFGTAMLIGGVGAAMLFVGGARLLHVGVTALVGIVGFGGLILQSPIRLERILAFLHPWQHARGAAYQQIQSLIAVGSGGPLGKGLGGSSQKLFFLPEVRTDFVFSVIGEEMGLVGAAGVLVLFGLLVYHGMRIVNLVEDPFRSLVAFGVVLAVGGQALVNVAVVTGCVPTKGIALPFISLGGSSLVGTMIGIGLVLAVVRTELQGGRAAVRSVGRHRDAVAHA